jgi:hypothetical protein
MATAPQSTAITITEEQLAALVAARVAEVLTEERIVALAAARIDARIGRLTLAEAMPRLGCGNIRQLKDKCRALKITIYKELGQKCPYILLRDLEARQTARARHVPLVSSISGTRIGRVDAEADRRAA